MNELKITDTNSANDSKGRALGLEGDDFVYVVSGVVAALSLCLVLTFFLHVGVGVSTSATSPLVIGPLAWVLLLRRNRPAGYAEDLIDYHVRGAGWSFAANVQPVRFKYADERRRA